jgi:endonuclease/exonuclease/phosphatase family metal-dependent hydrolase
MKRVTIVAVALWCLGTGAANPRAAHREAITVMTRNVYLGGNLGPLLVAASPTEFVLAVQTILAQVAATNFPERAEALADEIVAKKPDLVGLQEVFRFTVNGATAAPPFRDLLDDLVAALAARGEEYYVAAQVRNLAVTIPVPGLGNIGAIDRDVVLARADVATQPVPLAGCRASLDGCNYQVFVSLASPLGPINIERGFVAVDAHKADGSIRFVNTHLEVPELPVVVQAAQASELIAVVGALPNPAALPVVIVGDINSAPTDRAVIVNGQKIVPPYRQLSRAGYFDVWKLRPGDAPGFTCCQASDLLNTESLLVKRVDVIFTNVAPGDARAGRVGASPDDLTPSGLWPSDHAGVVARLWFEP